MQGHTDSHEWRIVADGLTYELPDGRALFPDVHLSFGRERTGLVGPNGSGKTTLIGLLAGDLVPSSGAVRRAGPVAVLPQDFRPAADAPLAVVLGIEERLAALRRLAAGTAHVADLEIVGDEWDLQERATAVLGRFGLGHLSLDRPVGQVSGGEATRVALAGLQLGRPDYLLLDEPTNHLDSGSREALYEFVDGWSGGLLCVSHDRALLRRMDRIVELAPGGVRVYSGNYDDYRERRDADDAAAAEELQSARAALRTARRKAVEVRDRQARREAQGRRDRVNANMPKILLNGRKAQAQATGARVRAIAAREVEERRARAQAARSRVEERERPRFDVGSADLPAGRTVVEIRNVTVRFPGAARPALDGVSLLLAGPERVAVTGPNGSGKSTLLRVVLGDLEPDSGHVRRLPQREIAALDQHGVLPEPELSVLDNFRRRHPDMDATAARHALARFLFRGDQALQPAGTLSGGEWLRASLACTLGGSPPPRLVVLDEPTNHLDIDAQQALEHALSTYDGALLVVSHDAVFLEAIGVDRTVVLEPAADPHSTCAPAASGEKISE